MRGRCRGFAFRWILAAGLWFAAGPLASPFAMAAACHHPGHPYPGAHSGRHSHQSGSSAGCWCDHMSARFDLLLGTSPLIVATPAAIHLAALVVPAPGPVSATLPRSPAYPPEPPPPNGTV